jgi:hypothetical protein
MFELFGTVASISGWWFLSILLLVFALFLILAGIFTAYFGSGKSRTIGVALLVVGLVVGVLVGYLFHTGTLNGNCGNAACQNQLLSLIWVAFEVIVAAVIGALVAIGIFLVAIMKS